MSRRRVRVVVEADLDPVPGWGNDPDDMRRMLQHYLDHAVPHYNPTVELDNGSPTPTTNEGDQ